MVERRYTGERGTPYAQGPAGRYERPYTHWIGPNGQGSDGIALPDLEDDDTSRTRVPWHRRRALLAIGGGAALVTGGAALALSAPGRELADKVLDRPPTKPPVADASGAVHRPWTNDGAPNDSGSFPDRDSSYARSAMSPAASKPARAGGQRQSSTEAAKAAAAAQNDSLLAYDAATHLLRRATFGPTQQELANVRQIGLDSWIEQQLNPNSVSDPIAGRIADTFPLAGMNTAQLRATEGDGKPYVNPEMDWVLATFSRQLWSSRQLFEVVADFWGNHLNIPSPYDGGRNTYAAWDREVIRKHAFGRFSDMLAASARSPRMLTYLNNAQSHKASVNENYGRELLELHSVGVNGGYNETDVRNAAYILTGRTVRDDEFVYDPNRHWTGPVKVMGFTHANASAADGLAVGDALVQYLATHKSTATNIARKLAVRFVSDNPPAELVQRLATTYLQSGTAILPVLQTLFRSVEFWSGNGQKTRRPNENVAATVRALGLQPAGGRDELRNGVNRLYNTLSRISAEPQGWVQPNGYPDVAVAWNSSQSTVVLWNTHRSLVRGGWREFTGPKAEDLLGGQTPNTMGGYLDMLSIRLVHQQLPAAQRQALLAFLGTTESSPVRDRTLGGMVADVAALILDSVFHALR